MARVGCSPEHPRYTAGCGDCNEIARREKQLTAARKAAGKQRRYMPISDVAPHARKLRGFGWRTADIAREALVSTSFVDELFREHPRVSNVVADLAERVLALELQPLDDPDAPRAGMVNATGTRRKVQALACLGHSQKAQAAEAGLSHHQVMMIARGEIRTVKKQTADAIGLVYDRWCTLPGEHSTGASAWMIRAEAEKRGWHDPLAWDRIDDPSCEPEVFDDKPRHRDDVDYANVRHALDGFGDWRDLTHAERLIVVRELSRRMDHTGLSEHLRASRDTIAKFCEREKIGPAPQAARELAVEARAQIARYCAPAGTPVRRRFDSIPASDAVYKANRRRKQQERCAA